MRPNASHRTAIARTSLSVPTRFLHTAGLLVGRCLDYGCGRGFDADTLGLEAYDPYWRPQLPRGRFDTIVCNYVLNVLPDEQERANVLARMRRLLRPDGRAYITVRTDRESLKGWTRSGTWQGLVELDLPVLKRTRGWTMYVLTH